MPDACARAQVLRMIAEDVIRDVDAQTADIIDALKCAASPATDHHACMLSWPPCAAMRGSWCHTAGSVSKQQACEACAARLL